MIDEAMYAIPGRVALVTAASSGSDWPVPGPGPRRRARRDQLARPRAARRRRPAGGGVGRPARAGGARRPDRSGGPVPDHRRGRARTRPVELLVANVGGPPRAPSTRSTSRPGATRSTASCGRRSGSRARPAADAEPALRPDRARAVAHRAPAARRAGDQQHAPSGGRRADRRPGARQCGPRDHRQRGLSRHDAHGADRGTRRGDARAGARARGDGPMGRLAAPEEIAAPVAFLCSEQASYVTGRSCQWTGA